MSGFFYFVTFMFILLYNVMDFSFNTSGTICINHFGEKSIPREQPNQNKDTQGLNEN